MNQPTSGLKARRTPRTDDLTPDRRRVLEVLEDRSSPVSERTLATELASMSGESRSPERIHCRLHHVDLSKLEEAGLVDWDRTDDVVEPRGSLDGGLKNVVEEEEGRTGEAGDPGTTILDAGVRERRRTVVEILDRHGSIGRTLLAREVALFERGVDVASETIADVETALHHVHLPKLDTIGLLSYDADTGRVHREAERHALEQ